MSVDELYLNDFLPEGDACHLARAEYRPGQMLAAHGHDFAELFFIERGSGIHRAAGLGSAMNARERSLVLRTGTVCLILPGEVHSIRPSSREPLVLANVAFDWDEASSILMRYGVRRPISLAGVTIGSQRRPLLALAFAELESSRRDQLSLDSFLLRILAVVTQSETEQADGLPTWLSTASLSLIANPERLADGVPGLASLAGRSPDHVNRVCRAVFRCTASDYVNRLRLDRAEKLLRTTELDVTEIAFESGYGNLSYFFRKFRDRWGTTPRRYRQAARRPVQAR